MAPVKMIKDLCVYVDPEDKALLEHVIEELDIAVQIYILTRQEERS